MSHHSHPNSINRDYIRLLQVMRRFVKEEFAVTIHMTQEDAVDQLFHYAEMSRNHVLREMAMELETFTTEEAEEEVVQAAAANEGVRYYRGAPVAARAKSEVPEPSDSSKPKRVYRGQVID